MNKPLPTRIHGILDYLSVPTLIALPRAFHWDKNLTALLTGAALGTLGTSLMTRYEWGLFKMLPMKTHLMIDFMTGATIAAAPLLLPDKENRADNALPILLALGTFEIMAALITKPESPIEYADNNLSNSIEDIKEKVRETVNTRG